jgi:very-short-patch-repair endonuclease
VGSVKSKKLLNNKMAKPKANHKFDPSFSKLANNLRKSSTVGEKKLWKEFQNLRLSTGIRFRRQQPIGHYIADFYCASHKFVVEIDGISHDTKLQQDTVRDLYFEKLGIKTFRFTEKEVLLNPTAIIETLLGVLSLPTPPLAPPSRGGV